MKIKELEWRHAGAEKWSAFPIGEYPNMETFLRYDIYQTEDGYDIFLNDQFLDNYTVLKEAQDFTTHHFNNMITDCIEEE